jgi:hypothetical protein
MKELGEKFESAKGLTSPFFCTGDLTIVPSRSEDDVETLKYNFKRELLRLPTLVHHFVRISEEGAIQALLQTRSGPDKNLFYLPVQILINSFDLYGNPDLEEEPPIVVKMNGSTRKLKIPENLVAEEVNVRILMSNHQLDVIKKVRREGDHINVILFPWDFTEHFQALMDAFEKKVQNPSQFLEICKIVKNMTVYQRCKGSHDLKLEFVTSTASCTRRLILESGNPNKRAREQFLSAFKERYRDYYRDRFKKYAWWQEYDSWFDFPSTLGKRSATELDSSECETSSKEACYEFC